ncbi:MAG TPA: hypothetical protein VLG16_01145 [Candidatus Saccharimonadales bacterium]|nr:hypothetical protein [Candidatus Saccharimonadales bacterium]
MSSEIPDKNLNSGFGAAPEIDFGAMARGAILGHEAEAKVIPAEPSFGESTYRDDMDDDTTEISSTLPPAPVDAAGKPVTPNVDPYSTPDTSSTPEVSKTSGGFSISGYSARKFSDRKSATTEGAEELWEERRIALEAKSPGLAAEPDEKKKLDGFGHDDFIEAVQKSQVATFRAKKSNSVVMVRGYGTNGGEVATKIAKGIVDVSEAIGKNRTDVVRDASRDMVSTLEIAKKKANSSAKDHDSSASVVAVKVLPECITVGAAGDISVLMKAEGDSRYLRPTGIDKDGSKATITPQGSFYEYSEDRDLFGENADPKAVTFATGGRTVRMLMVTESTALGRIMSRHPKAFDEAFSQEKAADATAALQKLYQASITPNQDTDISVMVVDITPEGAAPIDVPFSEASKPKASSTKTPETKPEPEPEPAFAPAAPANTPTGNRQFDALDLLTGMRLSDAARWVDITDPNFLLGHSTESKAFRKAINQRYQDTFNNFVDHVARRSNAVIGVADFTLKKFNAASHDFFEALSDRHSVNAIMLEEFLRKNHPALSDQERDDIIKQQIDLSMLGGDNVHDWLQPGTAIPRQEGVISELRQAIHNRSLELAGWKRDTSGNVTAPTGYRKYVRIFTDKVAELANKSVDQWAEWGTQGAKGVAKRVGVGLLAGTVTSAVAAVAAPAGTAGSVVASGFAATRVGKALVTTKLNKSAKTINAAENVRDQRIEELQKLYTKGGGIAVKNQLSREVERAQIKNVLRTGIAATVPMIGALGIENFFSENIHLPSGAPTGHQGIDAGHAPAISHSSTPSARPSGSASAPASGHSSAGAPTSSAKPSASASARPATGTPSRPSTSGATPAPDRLHGGRLIENNDSNNGTQQPTHLRGGGRPLQSSDAGNHTPTQAGSASNHAPAPTAPEGGHTVELSVHSNDQTIWDVVNHAGNGNNLSQSQKWQMVLDSAKSAQAAGQLHTFYQPDGTYYYQALVNGHWTDNTTAVAKTLSKFSKGKFVLAA